MLFRGFLVIIISGISSSYIYPPRDLARKYYDKIISFLEVFCSGNSLVIQV